MVASKFSPQAFETARHHTYAVNRLTMSKANRKAKRKLSGVSPPK